MSSQAEDAAARAWLAVMAAQVELDDAFPERDSGWAHPLRRAVLRAYEHYDYCIARMTEDQTARRNGTAAPRGEEVRS